MKRIYKSSDEPRKKLISQLQHLLIKHERAQKKKLKKKTGGGDTKIKFENQDDIYTEGIETMTDVLGADEGAAGGLTIPKISTLVKHPGSLIRE